MGRVKKQSWSDARLSSGVGGEQKRTQASPREEHEELREAEKLSVGSTRRGSTHLAQDHWRTCREYIQNREQKESRKSKEEDNQNRDSKWRLNRKCPIRHWKNWSTMRGDWNSPWEANRSWQILKLRSKYEDSCFSDWIDAASKSNKRPQHSLTVNFTIRPIIWRGHYFHISRARSSVVLDFLSHIDNKVRVSITYSLQLWNMTSRRTIDWSWKLRREDIHVVYIIRVMTNEKSPM